MEALPEGMLVVQSLPRTVDTGFSAPMLLVQRAAPISQQSAARPGYLGRTPVEFFGWESDELPVDWEKSRAQA